MEEYDTQGSLRITCNMQGYNEGDPGIFRKNGGIPGIYRYNGGVPETYRD